ncbi:hypothetical protein [Silvanigrella sp.]|jgi:hypothetical protein|uniref:hypothetical protein n=1 Tax=Silvanigrella sp. TaxID=2024976 RepID=UPI0037C5B639
MRINVFSPLSYTWERFAELQHQYAMVRRRHDLRHFDKLDEARLAENINENIVKKEIMKKKLMDKKSLNLIVHKEVLKRALDKEFIRIKFEREYLENLFIIGKKIKEHMKSIQYLHKTSMDKYLLEMKIENELRYQNDLLYKHEFKKLEKKPAKK